MICRELGALFVHIPKAAGQSVERVLLAEMGMGWDNRSAALLAPNADPAKGPPRLAHLTTEEYLRYGWLTKLEFDQIFKFAFVRNPWSRLVSEYRYRGLAPALGFRDFVLSRFPTPADDDYVNAEDHYRHVLPQSRFLYDAAGNCLVDFVGRFERIEQDFAVVAAKLGLHSNALPHSNASRQVATADRSILTVLRGLLGRGQAARHNYESYFDDSTRHFVENTYAEDIERFGYRFGES